MKLTGERISLINRLYDTTTRVQVHDLTDAEVTRPVLRWCWKYHLNKHRLMNPSCYPTTHAESHFSLTTNPTAWNYWPCNWLNTAQA
jgi:hypothetical protein